MNQLHIHPMLTQPQRFCDAMIEIRKEAEEIISGKQPKDNNLLKNAPHPISVIVSSEDDWKRFVLFSLTSSNIEQS